MFSVESCRRFVLSAAVAAVAAAVLSAVTDAAASVPRGFRESGRFDIAADGVPVAVIVVAGAASGPEIFAAEELRKYIRKISGAELEIVPEGVPVRARSRILVGGASDSRRRLGRVLDGMVEDAFVVGVAGRDLVLAGAGGRGTVYAVYDFLERELGCRWLGRGELWKHVPRVKTLRAVVKARLEEPAMVYRDSGAISWAIKNKSNLGLGKLTITTTLPFEWLSEGYKQRQGELPFNLAGWSNTHSGPHDLIPGDRAVRDNPEWFALQEDGSRHQRWLCYSHPEVTDLLADRLSQISRECPYMYFVHLDPGDWVNTHYCRCGGCMELDAPGAEGRDPLRGFHTHRILRYINSVAEALGERAPGRKLLTDPYSSYQEPPAPGVVKPLDNVMVRYNTWGDCRVHGYEHAVEDERRLPEMLSHGEARAWYEEWISIAPAGFIMSEYIKRASMDGMAGTNPRRFIRDMRYLHENGVAGYRAFGGHSTFGLEGINSYAALKAMWDPYLDEDELVRDYCDHAFHEASGHMQDFINTIEDAMQEAGCSHVSVTSYMTPGVMSEARRHLDLAHEAAEGNELVRRRLVAWEIHFGYQELAGPATEIVVRAYKGNFYPEYEHCQDPVMMREAIEMGKKALEYRDRMREEHPDLPWIPFGHRMSREVRAGGSWHRLLEQVETEIIKEIETGQDRPES